MLLRYTESEFAEIRAAARDAGLTPTGYAADAALAMATGTRPPTTAPWRPALLELMDARGQVRRVGANVNQAAHVLDGTSAPPVWLDQVMAMATKALVSLEEAATAVGEVARHDARQGRWRQPPRRSSR